VRGEGPLGGLFRQANAPASNAPAGNAPSPPPQGGAGGGLLDWLQNGLGGALAGSAAGGAAGSAVSGGLNELLKRLQQNGLGDAGQSWVGHGPNQPVTPDSLRKPPVPTRLTLWQGKRECLATSCCGA
jgi:uncharacterized protein YidB (DUF937 family)